jgi:hypothetical protein
LHQKQQSTLKAERHLTLVKHFYSAFWHEVKILYFFRRRASTCSTAYWYSSVKKLIVTPKWIKIQIFMLLFLHPRSLHTYSLRLPNSNFFNRHSIRNSHSFTFLRVSACLFQHHSSSQAETRYRSDKQVNKKIYYT